MFSVKGLRKEDLVLVAEELGLTVDVGHKIVDLKRLIESSPQYESDDDFVRELLITTVEERKGRERRDPELLREEQQAALELEKTKLELARAQLEIAKIQAESRSANSDVLNASSASMGTEGQSTNVNSLESLVRSIRTLTLAVPTKPEAWNLFFTSLEKSFEIKKVEEDYLKVEILLNLLGERAANLLVYVDAEEMKDYQKVKCIILKEFQPTPEACLENFVSAKRGRNESHVQFASRLRANWDFYCQLRKVSDLETLKELIVSDRLLDALDSETRSYVRIKQLDTWLKPKQIGELSDNYFTSKGRNFSELYNKPAKVSNQSDTYTIGKYVPPHIKNNVSKYGNQGKLCRLCKQWNHLPYCPNKIKNRTGAIKTHVKRDSFEGNKQDDKLIAKVKAEYLNEISGNNKLMSGTETKYTQGLQYIYIWLGERLVKTLIDSAAEMPIINSKEVPQLFETGGSKVQLVSAFGDKVLADLKTFPIALMSGDSNESYGNVDILFAVTDKLAVPCIIPPQIYELIKSAQVLGREAEREETGGFTPYCLGEPQELIDQMSSDSPLEGEKEERLGLFCLEQEMQDKKVMSVEKGKLQKGEDMSDQVSDALLFKTQQRSCETLEGVLEQAKQKEDGFCIREDIIYHKDKILGESVIQLVVPKVRREQVLKLGHESIFANHLGMRKTKERIRYSFFWPNMSRDIEEYCRTCKECQLRSREKSNDRIPIIPIPRPQFPFDQVNIDIIGPIEPSSARKHKYILCLVDRHSRWPEAVPLRSITAKATCDALLEIFMRTGIPRMISSDQGTNFVSKLTQEFHARLGAHPRFATPGHPESSGLVERYNQVLKNMLHHVIRSDPKNWDKHIPYLLFAYREVPNCTTGVPPFKLMYGREVRGPLAVLKSSWAGEIPLPINIGKSASEYLQELKMNLETAAEQAALIAETKQGAYAKYSNRRAVYKEFKPGDQVYLLIPDSNNKLYARWTGPAQIVSRINPDSYKVKLIDGKVKHVHVNKIRRFRPRVQAVGVIFENEEELGEVHPTPSRNGSSECYSIGDVDISQVDEARRNEIRQLLTTYEELFSNTVQIAKVGEHRIRLNENERKKPYVYRIPETLKPQVDKQIKELLDLGLIEESDAEIAHPVVCVMKKDGALRLCVDFRALNAATIPDDFPMENPTDLMFCIGKANIISTIDLLKGYWAIPLEKESQDLATFKTHRAQYRFKVMPFGLRNAAATFQREMNKVLAKYQDFARAYIDDIAVFSESWEDHIVHLNTIFARLRELRFSVNLKKCAFARSHIKYLGHVIGSGEHCADPDKVAAIQKLARPQTKGQLRSLLGLCNYYRDYVPRYADTVPTNRTHKKREVPRN